ncbi:putative DnaJ domain, Chaperone J-domain superfamily [Helianthus annuus]|nr:putative DnaJ domain, Chaperone J-domain superfamily [Helianthus annuus]
MAISTSSSLFASPNLPFTSHKPSHSCSSSVRLGRATVERTGNTSSSLMYEVLGVGVGADTLAVKGVYRRLARVLHPDVGNCESSADEFMKVHLAYTTLVDPKKRAAYDRSLVQRRTAVSSSMRFARSYQSRRWETGRD